MSFSLDKIQDALRRAHIDAWLFYDFRGMNPIALRVLGLDPTRTRTRRFMYYVPTEGAPVKIVHVIEPTALDVLPGTTALYASWRTFEEQLGKVLRGYGTVAMEYAPFASIPVVSRVDAGTVELVRATGTTVVSSANLVQQFEAQLSDAQIASHRTAADALSACVDDAFTTIRDATMRNQPVDESQVLRRMVDFLTIRGMTFDHAPIVAVNANAANPHYETPDVGGAQIRRGDLVLLDLWCKQREGDATYADITWTGYVGETVPKEIANVFTIVAAARDAALTAIRTACEVGKDLRGCDVDDVCRRVIIDAGYDEYFTHRTGHSIGDAVHGNGTNIDNFETRDERLLLPRTCFSIEPGIYLPGRFGIRSEIDVLLTEDGSVEVAGRTPQTAVVSILG